MINRKEIKRKSKLILKRSYWYALLVSFLLLVAGAGNGSSFNIGSYSGNRSENPFDNSGSSQFDLDGIYDSIFGEDDMYTYSYRDDPPGYTHTPDNLWPFAIIIIGVVLFVLLLASLYRVFLGYPLEVGCRSFFINSASDEKITLSGLSVAFKSDIYLNVIKAMFLRSLFLFLWSLFFTGIFIISLIFSMVMSVIFFPAILVGLYYKLYSYSLVPYILADNPGIGASRALQLSQQMTDGHVLNMFVLDLSFIGWYILGFLALIIGILFVRPYPNTAKACYYAALKELAVQKGLTSEAELTKGFAVY